jgi:hypothetical protein
MIAPFPPGEDIKFIKFKGVSVSRLDWILWCMNSDDNHYGCLRQCLRLNGSPSLRLVLLKN